MSHITPIDIARASGLSPTTCLRFLKQREGEPLGHRKRRRFPPEQLSELVTFCQSKQQRKRLNRNNARPLEPTPSAPPRLVGLGIVRSALDA